ncbi:SURF1 family cytochrome oxidase biogenesis protein [Arthrobacter sp. 35W]|uniref:SURF1 family cytochrome oxidase biogenesis protein n=1 Tax=Arthrobacter sp. 35W TaxID=1132441 RepID=UPI00041009FD|nr:SURF1 family protein [Arthrobacter sp. 35W]
MARYKFLLTSKWLGYFVLACFFAAVCASLGLWQMDRRTAVVANINTITTNYSAAPVDFAVAKDQFESLDSSREWSQVTLHGSYDLAGQRIVRNRPLNGQPGYEVVVPFRLDSGETVIVDRGWLPIGNKEAGYPDSIPEPVPGPVTAVVRLKPAEPKLQRGAPEGQLASIDLASYAQTLPYPVLTGAYGQLASESPSAATTPVAFPMPSVDEGSHLSYSMQWFCFGLLIFVGFGYAARQQALNDAFAAEEAANGIDPEELLGRGSAFVAKRPKTRKAGAKPTAEEEEDALLDAQGF